MSYQSFPWRSSNGDRIFKAADLTEFFRGRFSDGVSKGLQVIPYEGMTVALTDGWASILGTQYRSYSDNGVPTTFSLGVASGSYDKYVSVFLRRTEADRTVEPVVREGTAASNPVRPAIQRDCNVYEIRLADILIPRGATAIDGSMIHITIAESECGISINQPVGVEADKFAAEMNAWLELYKQAKSSEFETWFEAVQDALTENPAGNLYTEMSRVPNIVIAETAPDGSPIFPQGEGTYIVIG